MLFPVTAGQLDFRLVGLTIDGQHVADALYFHRAGFTDDGIHNQLFHLTIFRRNLNLDQLVVVERQIDLGQHTFGQTVLSQQDDRLQTVGKALEVLFLFIVENHGNFFISQG